MSVLTDLKLRLRKGENVAFPSLGMLPARDGPTGAFQQIPQTRKVFSSHHSCGLLHSFLAQESESTWLSLCLLSSACNPSNT